MLFSYYYGLIISVNNLCRLPGELTASHCRMTLAASVAAATSPYLLYHLNGHFRDVYDAADRPTAGVRWKRWQKRFTRAMPHANNDICAWRSARNIDGADACNMAGQLSLAPELERYNGRTDTGACATGSNNLGMAHRTPHRRPPAQVACRALRTGSLKATDSKSLIVARGMAARRR